MPFDPFGDFETRGYLRNTRGYKTASGIKRFEHREYYKRIHAARETLGKLPIIDYSALLETHRILFGAVYPWAGQDRDTLSCRSAIVKGRLHFAPPDQIHRLASRALTLGADPAIMATQPGLVLGDLAFAHPFLDGNGRTFLAVLTELARRAAISIDWAAVPLRRYLTELTKDIVLPGEGYLDTFLKPFVHPNPDRIVVEQHQPGFSAPAPTTRAVVSRDASLRSRSTP